MHFIILNLGSYISIFQQNYIKNPKFLQLDYK